ncbi:MAG: putative restriction endonuclease [Solirubrobacteraceae bacterium]|nr:putative restriction endonuclease [Solirubrobacteraceae bacterium]
MSRILASDSDRRALAGAALTSDAARVEVERDYEMRLVAIDRIRRIADRYDGIVPLAALREPFAFEGQKISFGSFYSGIFRPRQMRGPAALCLVTTPPKPASAAPYEDGLDPTTNTFIYHYRTAHGSSLRAIRAAEADNASLRAAIDLAVPLIYFHGIAQSQYAVVAPVFVVRDDPSRRVVELQAAMFLGDASNLGSGRIADDGADLRRYATREALVRLHQQRFRTMVLRAYAGRCAICALREASLLQAAHILEDRDPRGAATVVNGIAMCAIHHLAYDRNVMGIDPGGTVRIAERLLREIDGPMLRTGLQGFHGAKILRPRRVTEQPDPERLAVRYEAFRAAA